MLQQVQTRKSGWTGKATTPRDNPAWIAAVEIAKRVDCYDLVSRTVELSRAAGQEGQGPCPKCGGDDRLHVKPTGWFCRHCNPIDGGGHGWHNAIDWIIFTQGCTFPQAVTQLTGTQQATGGGPKLQPAATVKPKAPEPQTDEWRTRVQPLVDAALLALLTEDNAGAAYLAGRGLTGATWAAFGFGFGSHKGQPCIVIPWQRAGKLQAVRYRFLAPQADGPKILSEPGSKFAGAVYGGQAVIYCAERLRTLVICEGEINAASIWQIAHDSYVDVLSTGSESAIIPPSVLEYAAKFRTVIVWMDKADIAQKWAALMPGATAVASPGGKDANDLLQAGKLGRFLSLVRRKACATPDALTALKWDLWDAHNLHGGVDAGTLDVLEVLQQV